ncbi:hypothetical protein [Celeribacter litoreus]|uniref:hypothetical protein n=1 Tax=Celeribacter litoreus TaxID=2876714 RepID=UPI001CCA19B3|nr:hypothetical protein [Celeribacter litoreus]MCA0043736.1 hypothetical protein [Celeribacter litoreus]
MRHAFKLNDTLLLTPLTAIALGALVLGYVGYVTDFDFVTPAYALEDGSGSGAGHGGPDDDRTDGSNGAGQGGPGDDSDGDGPRAGQGDETAGDGAPTWASEGIPEIELGRLNVARSPDHVLEQALAESLTELADGADFYNLTHDQMVYVLKTYFDKVPFVDSPLQNLALYDAYLNGEDPLDALGVDNDVATLLAAFLGAASDKTVLITVETVEALTVIFEVEMTDAEMETIAADAEEIRLAILAGHG